MKKAAGKKLCPPPPQADDSDGRVMVVVPFCAWGAPGAEAPGLINDCIASVFEHRVKTPNE